MVLVCLWNLRGEKLSRYNGSDLAERGDCALFPGVSEPLRDSSSIRPSIEFVIGILFEKLFVNRKDLSMARVGDNLDKVSIHICHNLMLSRLEDGLAFSSYHIMKPSRNF